MPALVSLGWDRAWEAQFERFRSKGGVPGRVCLEHNHVYRVLTEQGEVLAETSGRIKYLATGRRELPAVGDWVALRLGRSGERTRVTGILPRRTWFSRKVAGRDTEEQVLAANAEVVLLVFGLDSRSTCARSSGIDPRPAQRRTSGGRPEQGRSRGER
jgi:ribosome biogenesis GTPase